MISPALILNNPSLKQTIPPKTNAKHFAKEPSLRDLKRRNTRPSAPTSSSSSAPAPVAAPAVPDVDSTKSDSDSDMGDMDIDRPLYLSNAELAGLRNAERSQLSLLDEEDSACLDGLRAHASDLRQLEDGRVVLHRPPPFLQNTLGSVLELKSGTSGATLKIKCYLHSKCELFFKLSNLTGNVDQRARNWLLHGHTKYGTRRDLGEKHKADAHLFFPKKK